MCLRKCFEVWHKRSCYSRSQIRNNNLCVSRRIHIKTSLWYNWLWCRIVIVCNAIRICQIETKILSGWSFHFVLIWELLLPLHSCSCCKRWNWNFLQLFRFFSDSFSTPTVNYRICSTRIDKEMKMLPV